MHYGIEVVPFGDFSDPRQVVRLAQAAEAAGWEGLWIWDHVVMPYGVGDPWVILAAVAACTKSMKLCVGVSPLPRYRPHLLARTLAGLDLLSAGRLIFATGLGISTDFVPFGEPADEKTRAGCLTKAWACWPGISPVKKSVIRGFITRPKLSGWRRRQSKSRASRSGSGGGSKAALRRAARWDGWIMGTVNEKSEVTTPPENIAAQVAYLYQHRKAARTFRYRPGWGYQGRGTWSGWGIRTGRCHMVVRGHSPRTRHAG